MVGLERPDNDYEYEYSEYFNSDGGVGETRWENGGGGDQQAHGDTSVIISIFIIIILDTMIIIMILISIFNTDLNVKTTIRTNLCATWLKKL